MITISLLGFVWAVMFWISFIFLRRRFQNLYKTPLVFLIPLSIPVSFAAIVALSKYFSIYDGSNINEEFVILSINLFLYIVIFAIDLSRAESKN